MKKKIEAARVWIRNHATKVSYNLFAVASLLFLVYAMRSGLWMEILDWIVLPPLLFLSVAQATLHNMRDKTDREKATELAQVRQSLNEAIESIDEWREMACAQNRRIEELECERTQHLATIERLTGQKRGLLDVLWWMFEPISLRRHGNHALHDLSAWLIDRKIGVSLLGGAHEDRAERCLTVLQQMRTRFAREYDTWRKERDVQEREDANINAFHDGWSASSIRTIFVQVAAMNRVRRVPREIRSMQDELVLKALDAIAQSICAYGGIKTTTLQYMLGSDAITAEELQKILRDLQTNKGNQFAQILKQMPEDVHRFLTAIMADTTSVQWPDVNPVAPGLYADYNEDDF